MHTGFRFRFLLESTHTPGDGREPYRLEVGSHGQASFKVGSREPIRLPSGLDRVQTQESLVGLSALAHFASSELTPVLEELVLANDRLRVEIGGWQGPLSLVHDGFVSAVEPRGGATPDRIQGGMTVRSEGLDKLFRQAIWNWQSIMALGRNAQTEGPTTRAYDNLRDRSAFLPPHEVVRELIGIGLQNSVELLVEGSRVREGGFFQIGKGKDWSSYYPDGIWPTTALRLFDDWRGSFWDFLMSMAEPDLHEFFFTYAGEPGKELTTLIHRPRPFPGPPSEDEAWHRLKVWRPGNDDGIPGSTAVFGRRHDGERVNAFHWGQYGFQDSGAGSAGMKFMLGWWVDAIGKARYGFCPRQVTTQLVPKGEGWNEFTKRILMRVAYQEAPLWRLWSQTHTFAPFLVGIRPGHVLEDWTSGRPSTGYVASVAHTWACSTEGIQAGTTVATARGLRGVTAKDYPDRVRALVALKHQEYESDPSRKDPGDTVREGCTTPGKVQDSGTTRKGTPSGVPYGPEISAAASRHNIPGWYLAAILQKESSFGRDAKCRIEQNGYLGIGQIKRVVVDDLARVGYAKPTGGAYTLEDRLDDKASIDASGKYLAMCRSYMRAAGLPEGNPDYWRWVSDCYQKGPGAAATAGNACGWSASGLGVYGASIDIAGARSAFGGL